MDYTSHEPHDFTFISYTTRGETPEVKAQQNGDVKEGIKSAGASRHSQIKSQSNEATTDHNESVKLTSPTDQIDSASSTARETNGSTTAGMKARTSVTSPPTTSSSNTDSSPASLFNQINSGGLGTTAPRYFLPSDTFDPQSARYKFEQQLSPSGKKSLSGIALRSHLLGIALASSIWIIIHLLSNTSTPLWRIPFFIATLSTFHFLEFFTLAYANTPEAQISTFLFTSNGLPYAIAHTSAVLECVITNVFFPNFRIVPYQFLTGILVFVGIVMVVMGQGIRSAAILSAGKSFTHIVQTEKRPEHVLVTGGIYQYLRHPSYFGFFWWGLGTQVVLGNTVSFIGYAVVLHRFFSSRIRGEEKELVEFFGDEYTTFRDKTPVGIPLIK